VRRFKFTQAVAGADKVDAFVDDHPPTHDIAVSNRSSASASVSALRTRFDCRGLIKPAGRTPLLQPALLIDPNFRQRDVHLVEMRVHPFDDRACSTCVRTRVASLKTASGMLTGVPTRSSSVGHNEGVGPLHGPGRARSSRKRRVPRSRAA
jgi:hypothetical protein